MGRGGPKRPVWAPIVGAVVLWAIGWILLPGLDPAPRGEWLGRSRTTVSPTFEDGEPGITVGRRPRNGFPRPWCPVCAVVEDHLTDNRWVNQTAGIAQLIGLGAVSAGLISLVDGGGGGSGGRLLRDRRARIEQERIERAVASSRRRRRR